MLYPTRRPDISIPVRNEATIGSTVQGSQGVSKFTDSKQELWQNRAPVGWPSSHSQTEK